MLLRVLLLGVAVALAGCSAKEPAPDPPTSWEVELSTPPTLLALTPERARQPAGRTGRKALHLRRRRLA